MPNIITGASLLGMGFNVLGRYDFKSALNQIFVHQTEDAQTFTYPQVQVPGGPPPVTYDVPDNISPQNATGGTSQAYTFANREEVQKHFASSLHASLSTGFGLAVFSGAFNASFSDDQESMHSSTYGIYEENFTAWVLTLSSTDPQWLDPDFIAAMNELPSTFEPINPGAFYAFFAQWGTHFAHEVTVGARMYYVVTVEDSYTSDLTQTHADISLEYKAVFTDTEVQSAVDWSNLNEKWSSSRQVTVQTEGGDTSLLNLVPGQGDWFGEEFRAWNSAIMDNPVGIDFKLKSLATLFSGEQASAVAQAIAAYINCYVTLNNCSFIYTPSDDPDLPFGTITVSQAQTLLSGDSITPTAPQPPPPYANGYPPVGFNLTILDGLTLEVILNKGYYLPVWELPSSPGGPTPSSAVYETMFADVVNLQQQQYIVVLAGTAVPSSIPPTEDFALWLGNCGADLSGTGLVNWEGVGLNTNYLCVGQQGLQSGQAYEYSLSDVDVEGAEANPPFVVSADMTVILYPPVAVGLPYTILSPFTA